MFCPNGHNQFIVGPEYLGARAEAIMTCLQCGNRFDAYTTFGITPKAVRKAA